MTQNKNSFTDQFTLFVFHLADVTAPYAFVAWAHHAGPWFVADDLDFPTFVLGFDTEEEARQAAGDIGDGV